MNRCRQGSLSSGSLVTTRHKTPDTRHALTQSEYGNNFVLLLICHYMGNALANTLGSRIDSLENNLNKRIDDLKNQMIRDHDNLSKKVDKTNDLLIAHITDHKLHNI